MGALQIFSFKKAKSYFLAALLVLLFSFVFVDTANALRMVRYEKNGIKVAVSQDDTGGWYSNGSNGQIVLPYVDTRRETFMTFEYFEGNIYKELDGTLCQSRIGVSIQVGTRSYDDIVRMDVHQNPNSIDGEDVDCGDVGDIDTNAARDKLDHTLTDEEMNPNQNPPERDENGEVIDGNGGSIEEGVTCNIGHFGWVICPGLSATASAAQWMFQLLANWILEVKVNTFTTEGGDSGVYQAWKAMRDMANLIFLVAFLVVIYSQISGVGINVYGIRTMIPKLLLSAVLINISFYLCQLAIDISNVAGYAVASFFMGTASDMATASGTTNSNWAVVAGQVVILGLAAIGLVVLYLSVTLAGILAFVANIILLMIRQILIMGLVIISPLAIAMMIFPNTESLFRRWWSVFFKLLVIFPIISALLGLGILAQQIIRTSAQTVTIQGAETADEVGASIQTDGSGEEDAEENTDGATDETQN